MQTTFSQLSLGTRFEYLGKSYTKVSLSMALDEKEWGHFFGGEGVHLVSAEELGPKADARKRELTDLESSSGE